MSDREAAPKLKVADRWPVIYNWAHGGTVSAPELIRECRDVLDYLGASPPSGAGQPSLDREEMEEQALAAYHEAYHGEFPQGGDAGDHDNAHREGVFAVLAVAFRPFANLRRYNVWVEHGDPVLQVDEREDGRWVYHHDVLRALSAPRETRDDPAERFLAGEIGSPPWIVAGPDDCPGCGRKPYSRHADDCRETREGE
jgi:hypothetical protein